MNGWSSVLRQTTVLCLLLAVGLALVLFSVKYQVQGLEEELGDLNSQLAADQKAIHVLQVEFSFLTDPERLRRLSSRYLGLRPVEPEQLRTFATFDEAAGGAAKGVRPVLGSGLHPAFAKGSGQ